MADELQALLDRLDREGVRKGEEERDRLIAEAQAKAKAIVSEAEAKASQLVEQAENECRMLRQKAEESMRQSGRQILLQVRQELQERVQGAVSALLQSKMDTQAVGQAIVRICEGYFAAQGNTDDLAVLVPEAELSALEEAVKASLGEQLRARVSLKPDKRLKGGFRLTFSGSQVVYDFSDEALAEAIAAHLSPALGALVTG